MKCIECMGMPIIVVTTFGERLLTQTNWWPKEPIFVLILTRNLGEAQLTEPKIVSGLDKRLKKSNIFLIRH